MKIEGKQSKYMENSILVYLLSFAVQNAYLMMMVLHHCAANDYTFCALVKIYITCETEYFLDGLVTVWGNDRYIFYNIINDDHKYNYLSKRIAIKYFFWFKLWLKYIERAHMSFRFWNWMQCAI